MEKIRRLIPTKEDEEKAVALAFKVRNQLQEKEAEVINSIDTDMDANNLRSVIEGQVVILYRILLNSGEVDEEEWDVLCQITRCISNICGWSDDTEAIRRDEIEKGQGYVSSEGLHFLYKTLLNKVKSAKTSRERHDFIRQFTLKGWEPIEKEAGEAERRGY